MPEQASVAHRVEFPLENMGSELQCNHRQCHNPARIGIFLNLSFKGRLQTVLALLHGSVTGRRSLGKSSCEVDGREILPKPDVPVP